MHELHQIYDHYLTGLSDLGLEKVEEHWDEAAFGSGYIVIGRRKAELRIAWDGKEGCCFLAALREPGEWRDISEPICEADFGPAGPDPEKLSRMIEAGREALSWDAA